MSRSYAGHFLKQPEHTGFEPRRSRNDTWIRTPSRCSTNCASSKTKPGCFWIRFRIVFSCIVLTLVRCGNRHVDTMRFVRPIGVERRHFQRLVNKVGTAVLVPNAAFSTACKRCGDTNPRLVSEHRARRNPPHFHHLAPARIRDYVVSCTKFTPTDSREEPSFVIRPCQV